MVSSSEQSLDCKPQSYSMLLKSFGDNFQSDQNTQKLENLLSCLEQERLKIEAFKRELPLCMQLLNNAVKVYKQQLEACRGTSNNNNNQSVATRPVLEEFIPLSNQSEKENNKGSNWVTTAQLWSQSETKSRNISDLSTDQSLSKDEVANSGHFDTNQRNGGGAFCPFSKEQSLPELALSTEVKRVTPTNGHTNDKDGNDESMINCGNANNDHNISNSKGVSSTTSQGNRKARCWSPELHRRFVQALQMLGGSQVATPKQIRELMKVDGLTNDEVKSHLQKYRLHTRRPSTSSQTSAGSVPHLVVLGGIWVIQEYTAAHGGSPTLYCSSQELYTTPPPPSSSVHHQHFRTFNGSCGAASTTDSAQHQIRDSVGREGKSPESSSLGERKGLAALRDDGEDHSNMNGSEITLKF